MRYDPDRPVNPKAWLALDEQERQIAVLEYHRKKRIKHPNDVLHAAMHAVVENQIAMGEQTPVAAVHERLMKQDGLDRHEAIHCIASVLAEVMHEGMTRTPESGDLSVSYYAALKTLTAASWRAKYKDED